jgi:hypothetical protein
MLEAKLICTPSLRSAIGGIPPSQAATPVAYLSPHLGAPLVTPGSHPFLTGYTYLKMKLVATIGHRSGFCQTTRAAPILVPSWRWSVRQPSLLLLRNLVDITCHKWFLLLLHVEPFVVPIPHRGVQRDIQIMRFHVILEKQIHSSGYFGPPRSPFLFEAEEMTP